MKLCVNYAAMTAAFQCIPVLWDGFGMRPWSNVPTNWRPKLWIYSDASNWHKVRLGKELDMLYGMDVWFAGQVGS